jgi:uncharacterized protein (DUF58 family)
MITARAFLVGIVGFCFYLIALVNTLPSYYYALTWLTLGILVSSFGIAVLSVVGLQCEWRTTASSIGEGAPAGGSVGGSSNERSVPDAGTVDMASGSAGSSAGTSLSGALAEVRLSNSGSISKTGLVIELQFSNERRDEIRKRRFVVESLAAGSSIDAALALHDLPRGRYRVTKALVIGSDVLGLFRVRRRLRSSAILPSGEPSTGGKQDAALAGEIIIGPATVSIYGVAPATRGGANEGRDATRLVGVSDDVGGTRAYVPGDDMRHVHWKSTARLDQLVVKEYHRAAQLQSAVIWDGTAQTTWGDGMVTSTEWGLCLTASLCRALIEAGRPCGLLRLDDEPLLVSLPARVSNPETTLARVAEALAHAVALRETPLSTALSAYVSHLVSGSTAYLVTASLSPDAHRAVEQLRIRGVHVVVAVIDGSAFVGELDEARDVAKEGRAKGGVAKDGGAKDSSLPPRQTWKAGDDGSRADGESAVTPEAYQAQVQSLRNAGVPTVLVPDDPGAVGEDFEPPLRAALYELMGRRPEFYH